MRVLYNTNQHAAMNDVSVTTGNADGWILVPAESVRPEKDPAPQTPRQPKQETKERPRSTKPKR